MGVELLEYAIVGGILYGIFFSLIGIGLNLIFGCLLYTSPSPRD